VLHPSHALADGGSFIKLFFHHNGFYFIVAVKMSARADKRYTTFY
jgi:hypothetical protein